MPNYEQIQAALTARPRRWLVSGAAGFIGSTLVEQLLRLGQTVTGLDDFSTGHQANLADVRRVVGPQAWERFHMIDGDIRRPEDCRAACASAEVVLHQAALGSVPRSVEEPALTNDVNVQGFVRLLTAAKDAGVRRFVFASSSAVYGDSPALPQREDEVGRPLSPYAASKMAGELYAAAFAACYGVECVGLRYFNVFGPRQDPNGAYAAVIPRWINEMLGGQTPTINGDGSVSRDFCYIDNVVQANVLAATTPGPDVVNQAYNIAVGDRTTLKELFHYIREALIEAGALDGGGPRAAPSYGPPRAGDISHSQADISKVRRLLGYQPLYSAREGMRRTAQWYARKAADAGAGDPLEEASSPANAGR